MKAFLVNEKDAIEIEMDNNLDAYYDLLNCRCFDIVSRKVGNTYFDIYCDDEGLLVDHPRVSAIDSATHPMLFGNLIFTHGNDEGETVGITDEDVKTIMDNVYMVIDRTHGTSHPVVMMEF